MATIQESANDETKSSAGDKYETGRAMMQLELEKLGVQLSDAQKQLQILHKINLDNSSGAVRSGSLVNTNHGSFFISVSAGILTVDGIKVTAISTVSPLGATLLERKRGDEFQFNGKAFRIESLE